MENLTKEGRLVLIQSTLAGLPVYLLSILIISVQVTEKLEQIMRNFLWGITTEARRYHFLSWDQITIPKGWGGLGIRRIRDMNQALLTKWIWRLGSERGLWKRVMITKYGIDQRHRCTVEILATHGCTVLKDIDS